MGLSAAVSDDEPPKVFVRVFGCFGAHGVLIEVDDTTRSGIVRVGLLLAGELLVFVDVDPGTLGVLVVLIPVHEHLSIRICRARNVPSDLSSQSLRITEEAEFRKVLPVVLGLDGALKNACI